MRPWHETGHCLSGVHCRTCRDREGGADFRMAMGKRFEMPDGWPECPHGKPWGYIGKSRGVGDTFAKMVQAVTFGLVKPCGGCKKRQRRLNAALPYRR